MGGGGWDKKNVVVSRTRSVKTCLKKSKGNNCNVKFPDFEIRKFSKFENFRIKML